MTTATRNPLAIGTKLPNGAIVLQSTPIRNDVGVCLVLCLWIGSAHPFAIWRCHTDTKECYWGHYHGDLEEAVTKYVHMAEELT